jgi:5'-nucleotidase
MKEEILIPNFELFEEKLNTIITDGAKELHIVTDFDKTLTKAWNRKRKVHTIVAQLREGNYLSEGYKEKADEFYNTYHPIEISKTIPMNEKKKKMIEWWGTHIKFISKHGMNKKIVNDIAKNKIILRKGTLNFINEIKTKKVPLLILSAALGDIIEKLLKINKVHYNGIHVISNFFKFDKKGNVLGYKGKIVHSLNKNEFEIKNTPFYKKIKERKNIILLGDSIDDLKMTEGIKFDTILKIGFLNERVEENLEDYKKAFDVIILNDGTMNFVNKLIREIK